MVIERAWHGYARGHGRRYRAGGELCRLLVGRVRDYGIVALNPDGLGFGKIFRDDTASRRFQKELMRRALHDPLTGLPNRALLLDRLSKALARLERHRESVAVFFVDLDGFKAINDRLGHQVGDAVLVAVAARLRAALRVPDTVARLSGDEFVVVCEGLPLEPAAGEIAHRLAVALAAPVVIDSEHILVSASIGVAVAEDAGRDLEALLREADTAMYHAKADRRSRHRIRFKHYDRAMQNGLPARDAPLQARCLAAPNHDDQTGGSEGVDSTS